MILKKWDDLPENLKNEKVKEYYDILSHKKIQLALKRIMDIILSFIMLIILSPIMLIIALLIKIDSKGPVFYKQERVTKYGKKFKILKFRTMIENADKMGSLVTVGADKRITKIGSKIRKYRIDEIPQLINIFIGDMSFVGTRPEVKKYVDRYTDEMKATLLMTAGVTSKASIEYRNEDEILDKYVKQGENIDAVYINKILPEKMKWNLEYIKYFNIFKDIKVMLDTVTNVLK